MHFQAKRYELYTKENGLIHCLMLSFKIKQHDGFYTFSHFFSAGKSGSENYICILHKCQK